VEGVRGEAEALTGVLVTGGLCQKPPPQKKEMSLVMVNVTWMLWCHPMLRIAPCLL
jgi:hypothetical protein